MSRWKATPGDTYLFQWRMKSVTGGKPGKWKTHTSGTRSVVTETRKQATPALRKRYAHIETRVIKVG